MGRVIHRAAIDAWVAQANPTDNHGQTHFLRVAGDAGAQQIALLSFPRGGPDGATGLEALARVHLADPDGAGDWNGTHHLTLKRLTSRWREHKVNWSNRPDDTASHDVTVTVVNGVDGQEVAFDCSDIMQDVFSGHPWHGVEILVDTNGSKRIYSSETTVDGMKPRLELTWGGQPLPATDLRPMGGQAVSSPTPTHLWTFSDEDGDDPQAAFQLREATNAGMTANLYDSGYVEDPQSRFDPTTDPAYVPVPAGDTRYWQVRVRNAQGLWSEYSDVVSFTYVPLGVLTLVSPTDTVQETTPPVVWTVGGGVVQRQFEVWLFGTPDTEVGWGDDYGEQWGGEGYALLWHSHRERSTDQIRRWPPGLIQSLEDNAYKVRLRVWDREDRVGLPGAPTYMQAEQVFTFAESTPFPVDAIAATTDQLSLLATWTYNHTLPDFWGLKVDGRYVDDRISPDDAPVLVPVPPFTGPNTYQRRVHNLRPDEDHTIEVVAIVHDPADGNKLKHSHNNPTATAQFRPLGIWFVDTVTREQLQLLDVAQLPQVRIGRSAAAILPTNRRDSHSDVDAVRGYEGTVSGTFFGNAQHRVLEHFAGNLPRRRYHMIWINESIIVEIDDITNLVPRQQAGGDPGWDVTISWRQVDWFFRLRH